MRKFDGLLDGSAWSMTQYQECLKKKLMSYYMALVTVFA
jgi:hypothetical protein